MFCGIVQYCLQEDPKLIFEAWIRDWAEGLAEQHQLIAYPEEIFCWSS